MCAPGTTTVLINQFSQMATKKRQIYELIEKRKTLRHICVLQAFIRKFADIMENRVTVFFRRKALFCRDMTNSGPYSLHHLVRESKQIEKEVDILHMTAVLVLGDLDGLDEKFVTSRVINRVLQTVETVQEKFFLISDKWNYSNAVFLLFMMAEPFKVFYRKNLISQV